MNKKLLLIQRFLPHYRNSFFKLLNDELKIKGYDLILLYSESSDKMDDAKIPFSKKCKIKKFSFFGNEVYWQNTLKYLHDTDILIVEQSNKILNNYYYLLTKKIFNYKIILWGHGLNHQIAKNNWRNRFKLIITKFYDGFLAYTKGVKKIVENGGYPNNRVFSVDNSIDTVEVSEKYNRINRLLKSREVKSFTSNNQPTGLFIGGMYKEKRLDFLIESCIIIKEKLPDFRMIFIGEGNESAKIKKFDNENDWVIYPGALINDKKFYYFSIADVLLMPGLVGLVILDSFCTQTPLITTENEYHSPEIEYLENGYNGIITENIVSSYSNEVVKLLTDKELLHTLKTNCKNSMSAYSISNMVENFINGIENCK